MIKTVIFDIDNTLYNYDKNHIRGMETLALYCRQEFGLTDEEFHFVYRQAMKITNERIGSDSAAIHSRRLRFQCMTELLCRPLFPHVDNMYHAYWDTLIENASPSPGSLEFIQNLKKEGVCIGIGTDMTAFIQYQKLEKLGFAPYVDFIVTSQEAGVEKPAPHFFDLCLEKSGCLPKECAFIGDNLIKDVQGACTCGMNGIWYTQEKVPEITPDFPLIVSFCDICLQEFLILS